MWPAPPSLSSSAGAGGGRAPQQAPPEMRQHQERRVPDVAQHRFINAPASVAPLPPSPPVLPNGLKPRHPAGHLPPPQAYLSPAPDGVPNSVISSIEDLTIRPPASKRVRFSQATSAGNHQWSDVGGDVATVAAPVPADLSRRPRKLPAARSSSMDSIGGGGGGGEVHSIKLSQELLDFQPEPAVPEALVQRAIKAAASTSPMRPLPSASTALVLYRPQENFIKNVLEGKDGRKCNKEGRLARLDEEEDEEDGGSAGRMAVTGGSDEEEDCDDRMSE